MRAGRVAWLAAVFVTALALAHRCESEVASGLAGAEVGTDSTSAPSVYARVRDRIERHLGRPYVWGAVGPKSFDCSGFVWRILAENGILMKRTNARRLYLCLPKVPEAQKWSFGNMVFFSNRTHCGIVNSRDTFYHAQTSKGTNLSHFDPLWRGRVCGVRALPWKSVGDSTVAGGGRSPAR